MNILHLKDTFDPTYEMRDETQFILQAIKHGHNISIVTSKHNLDFIGDSENLLKKDHSHKNKNKFKIIRCSSFKPPFAKIVCYLAPLRKIRENKDKIVFIHNLGSFSSFLIPIIKLIGNSNIILKADFGESTYRRAKKNWIFNKIITAPVHGPNIITCFTHQEKEYLESLGVPSSKIIIIPVGIDYENIPDLTKIPNSPAGECTIGQLGRMTELKGFHNVVEPMKKILHEFPKSKFIAGGPKTDEFYANEFIKNFENYNGFSYVGEISHNNIYSEFINKCDIILIPSLGETGSILCLEAMAAGKAIIASDIFTHRDYIQSGVNGYLAKNKDDYYTYCKKLLINPMEIRRLGKGARKAVKKFDWTKIGKHVEKIYEKLA